MNPEKIGVEAWAWQELYVKALMIATVARVSTTPATIIISDQWLFHFINFKPNLLLIPLLKICNL